MRRIARLLGGARGRRGQTTTEYLMIGGIMTMVSILLLNQMYGNLRQVMANATECVINRNCVTGAPGKNWTSLFGGFGF